MKVYATDIAVRTAGRGFVDVTRAIDDLVRASGVDVGLCTVFCKHTSASLLVQENADSAVRRDLTAWLDRLAPESDEYEHNDEGADDMPAHLKAAVLRTSETLPIRQGKLALGTWQAVYVVEHRRMPHARTLSVTIVG